MNQIHCGWQCSQDLAQKAVNISYDEASRRATFGFAQDISPSKQVVLGIEFTGIMNNNMAGFYRSKYKPVVKPPKSVPKEGDDHLMFSTQFESCSSREAFPCFDEPNLKASFDFSIEIPEDLVALSNMPERTVKDSKEGLKVVSFERTPVMSTYVCPLYCAGALYHRWADEYGSFSPGHLETWSTSRSSPNASMVASRCLCASTRQRV